YGTTPAYVGETPVKAADAQYTYTFSGWSPEEASVTGEQTYTAQFSSTVIKYTVKFLNEDGTLLQTESLDYGVTPTYKGATPTKAATAQYTYTFSGWSPAITTVTENAEYTATYSSTVNNYTVRFVNYDGEELQSDNLPYGSTPVYTGATPVKPSTEEFTYTFDGWNPEIDAITGTQTYTAQFIETRNEYDIRFLNYDGTELQNYPVAYGATPVYDGTTPTKPATAQYTYTFSGWEPELATVTKAQDYTATYSSTVNKYVIEFVNYDGTLLQETEFEYGEMPEYTGATPEKPATVEFTYTFSGWEPEVVAVTEAAIYTAQFSSTVNSYEIEVNVSADGGGTVTGDGTYLYGTEVTITATPDKGYAFEHWNNGSEAKSFTITVTGDNDYTAFFHTQNADNTPECDGVASLSKSDWMLMLNVKDLHTQGYVFSESNVSWYKIVGERDNLSLPSYMRDDQYVGTGYYYTMDKSLHGTGDYYGLVNLPAQTNDVGCLGIMRTETFNYAYQGSLRTALVPTIVAPGEELKIVELPDGENVEILVYDQVGKLYYQFNTGGVLEKTFNAPYNHGNYMVLVKSKDGEKIFKYIVK
ncbi:MAG: T9SS type A sorting domain-containing protein, partial [Paludibacteraceae bacterium]|nr:T9SS type A sorting domain-containing protein [Paludibacteraceae bacterium]